MNAAVDLEAIEAAILSAPPKDVAPLPDPETVVSLPEILPPGAVPEPVVELMTLEEFSAGWGMVHHMGGGVLSSRIGAPVELGDQAMSQPGMEACKAAYELARDHAPWMIKKSNGTIGKVMAIAMHGVTCVQIIRAAQGEARQPAATFKTTRKEPE